VSRRLVPILAVLAALGAVGAVGASLRAPSPSPALARVREGRAAPAPDGVQTVSFSVRAGEYTPSLVRVRAGAPLRLRVTLEDGNGCATRLLVPDLGVDLELSPAATAETLVAAPPPGRWLFTCGMKMVKGVLVAE